MGQNLFQILWNTIKSKLASIVSKIRLWTSWNFVRTRIIGGIKNFFLRLIDVKPRNKDDYYSIFGWLISKRLAYAIIIFIGIISLWYLNSVTNIYSKFAELNFQGSNRLSGNGLGLAQARAIVEYYGGTIYAKSTQGGGMGIYIQLPSR